MELTIELVPRTSWYSNVRSEVSRSEWDIIRRWTYRQYDYKCQVCGGVGPKHPVEAHEIWEYDDEKRIQTLVGMIALCPACHQVKHIGLAEIQGKLEQAIYHLAKVNGWSEDKALRYRHEQMKVWQERSENEYSINTDFIKTILQG